MEWKDEFTTGIHNIDGQHRTIVEFISLFENLARIEAHRNDLYTLISRTRKFVEFHFQVEESLMRILPYPNFAAHCAEHRRELQTIADIETRLSHQHRRHELAKMMRDCLTDHIVGGDKWLAQYALRLYGRRRTAAVAGSTHS